MYEGGVTVDTPLSIIFCVCWIDVQLKVAKRKLEKWGQKRGVNGNISFQPHLSSYHANNLGYGGQEGILEV